MTDESRTILNRLIQVSSRLDEQALEMTLLRNELDAQFKRIAHLQAQLDVLPADRRRRANRDAVTFPVVPPGSNGR